MIYFLKAGDFIAYKIGFTASDPLKRMADLQVGCPFKLELLGAIEGTWAQEQSLHELLANFKTIGEWFSPNTVVTEAIKRAIETGARIDVASKTKRQNRACEIIDLLGGNIAVGKLTGSNPKTVSNWRRFDQFPANTFVVLRNALAELGVDADPQLWGMVGIAA